MRDQRGQLQRLEQGDPSDFPQGGLSDKQVATIEEAAHVVGALVALGGRGREAAYTALADMAETATRRPVAYGQTSRENDARHLPVTVPPQ